jgi:hypothetical protein
MDSLFTCHIVGWRKIPPNRIGGKLCPNKTHDLISSSLLLCNLDPNTNSSKIFPPSSSKQHRKSITTPKFQLPYPHPHPHPHHISITIPTSTTRCSNKNKTYLCKLEKHKKKLMLETQTTRPKMVVPSSSTPLSPLIRIQDELKIIVAYKAVNHVKSNRVDPFLILVKGQGGSLKHEFIYLFSFTSPISLSQTCCKTCNEEES